MKPTNEQVLAVIDGSLVDILSVQLKKAKSDDPEFGIYEAGFSVGAAVTAALIKRTMLGQMGTYENFDAYIAASVKSIENEYEQALEKFLEVSDAQ